MKLSRALFIKLLAALWVVIWMNFILRDLTLGKKFSEYSSLLRRDAEQRRSLIYGDELYSFLNFSSGNVPSGASYELAGLDPFSLEYRRAAYYLYPRVPSGSPDYILAYHSQGYSRPGYAVLKEKDKAGLILKKE